MYLMIRCRATSYKNRYLKNLYYAKTATYWYDIAFLVSKQFSKADYMEEITGNPLYRFGKRISWNASKPSSLKEIDRTLQKKGQNVI